MIRLAMEGTMTPRRERENEPHHQSLFLFRCWQMAAIGFMMLCLLPSAPTPAHAFAGFLKPSSYTDKYVRCTRLGVQGSFDMFESTYRTDGMCELMRVVNTSGESTFENIVVEQELRWTGESRYEAGTHAVLERITVGNQVLESTMVCPQDPWLTQLYQPCTNIADRLVVDRPEAASGPLTDGMVKELRGSQSGIPFTSGIRPDQRALLNKQYQASRANLPQSKPPTNAYRTDPPAIGAPRPGVRGMMLAPPELVSPGAGNVVTQGAVLVKIRQSLGGRAEVNFTWIEPTQAPHSKTWQATMDQLAAGAIAPPEMTDKPGYWEVRVRMSRANPGPWSRPVRFLVTLSRQPSPIPRQKPSPMIQRNPSSFMQESPNALPGVIQRLPGQDAALNPQPLPPQAIPGVIMKSPGQEAAPNPQPFLPGVIMRRGMDEKASFSKEQKAGSKKESPAAATPAR